MGSRAKLANVPKLHELIQHQVRRILASRSTRTIPLLGLVTIEEVRKEIKREIKEEEHSWVCLVAVRTFLFFHLLYSPYISRILCSQCTGLEIKWRATAAIFFSVNSPLFTGKIDDADVNLLDWLQSLRTASFSGSFVVHQCRKDLPDVRWALSSALRVMTKFRGFSIIARWHEQGDTIGEFKQVNM